MSGVRNEAFTAEIEDTSGKNGLEMPQRSKETESYGIKNEGAEFENDKSRTLGCLATGRNAVEALLTENPNAARRGWIVALNLAIIVYFGFATRHWYITYGDWSGQLCSGYGLLVILAVIVYAPLFYYHVIKRFFGKSIARCFSPLGNCFKTFAAIKCVDRFGPSIFYLAVLAGVVIFMVIDTVGSRDRLISLLGAVVLIALGWIFSKYPTRTTVAEKGSHNVEEYVEQETIVTIGNQNQINWKAVIWGLILQFAFGLFTIRWSVGRAIFQCISDKVATFLNYALDGAVFVFSDTLVSEYQVFAFASLPVIFFFSFMVQILYYLGAMQAIVMKLGGLLQIVMGTSVCESITAVANIFLSMSESPLLIKPYVPLLTRSELHTVMASGFATVSGTVLAAYIRYGAEPAHLITASVMSAPAALCYSKLFYPETETSKTTKETIQLQKSEDTSVMDAASKGALAGMPIFLGVIANIIAFVSAVAFLNGIVSWLGVLVGYEDISFEWFLTKIFMPLSWLMGVPWDECEYVGTLIGLKTVVNEFVAYQRLGEYKNLNLLTARTEAIATYAICGFSNPGSVGIMIGALTSMAPEKRPEISSVAIRAFISGSAVCFLTACIAGMLMTDDFYAEVSTSTNTTSY